MATIKGEQQDSQRTNKVKEKTIKMVTKEIKLQSSKYRFVKACQENLFIRLPILVISFILAIAIFNESLISFGYVIIVMLLIIDLLGLSQSKECSDKLSFKLKWILLPYLLLDVLC